VLPDKTFSGRISRIVNEADIQKNTLQVKVAITDPSPQLKPEMLARVRFSGAAARIEGPTGASQAAVMHSASSSGQVIFAPTRLIHRMGDGAMAWVVDRGRGTASHRTIQLGQMQIDGWVAVASGLSPGDQLISDFEGLRDGQRVRVVGEADPSTLGQKEGSASHGSH
jgi:multidrug efflux pump subunit AcrA (membrane-fusion protein)